jgi:hypothetical protein
MNNFRREESMPRLISAAILLMLSLTLSSQAQNIELNDVEVNTPHNVYYYDVRYFGDTLYVAYLSKGDDILFYERFVDSSREDLGNYGCSAKITSNHYIRILDNHDLIYSDTDNFYYVDLRSGKVRIIKKMDRFSWSSMYGPKAFNAGDKTYFIYQTYSEYEKWIVAIDNNPRRFYKNFLIEIDSSAISKPELVYDGYSDCDHFQGLVENDTLYAVWQLETMKGTAWVESAGRYRSILFAKYDGRNWSTPDTVSPIIDESTHPISIAPKGLYKLDNDFYAFWELAEYTTHGNFEEIQYKWSPDGETWGPLLTAGEDLWFVDAAASPDQLLHIILSNSINKDSLFYYIFDGKNMEKQCDLPFKSAKDARVIFADDDNPHFFNTAKNNHGEPRLHHCVLKKR